MIPGVAFATLALLVGSAAAQPPPTPKTFPAGAKADYQINGGYTPPTGVQVVIRDGSIDYPVAGLYNICYVNGFQTQPGEAARWTGSGAILLDGAGNKVEDDGWPGEYILDIRTAAQRATIASVIGADIARCASRGFDAVEIDNLDTFTRYGGAGDYAEYDFKLEDATALSILYATQIHGLGMKIAQKNAAEFSSTLKVNAAFDFAVAEECVFWNECNEYSTVYGNSVIAIEYTDDWKKRFTPVPTISTMISAICAKPGRPLSTMLRDRGVVINTSPAHANARC